MQQIQIPVELANALDLFIKEAVKKETSHRFYRPEGYYWAGTKNIWLRISGHYGRPLLVNTNGSIWQVNSRNRPSHFFANVFELVNSEYWTRRIRYQEGKGYKISPPIMTKKLVGERLKELRSILGAKAVKLLQTGKAVFQIWRRSSPHNWWVEGLRGAMYWHSQDEEPSPHLHTFFKLVNESEERIWTPYLVGADEGAPEQSTYRLKKVYC